MNDLMFACVFVVLMFFLSIVGTAFDRDVKHCEIINEMVKYCVNEKGQRVRI